MRLQSILIAALGLIFSASAAIGVYSFANGRGKAPIETTQVVVAALDVARGMTITPDLIKVVERPTGTVPSGAMAKLEDALDRSVAISLVAGEPVLNAQLSPKGSGRGLAALVPKGMRAVTIQTPNVSTGVAGFVLPGNKVDVLLTMTDSGNVGDLTGGGATTNLLQKVEILAVDQRMDAPADNKVDTKELRSVTLLVTPHQANLLDLGQNKGTLHLSLRNRDDDADSGARPVTVTDLRFRQEKPWDDRLKGVIEAFAKAQRPPPPPPPAPGPEPAAPPVVRPPTPIRTIRGMSEGEVVIRTSDPSTPATQGRGASKTK